MKNSWRLKVLLILNILVLQGWWEFLLLLAVGRAMFESFYSEIGNFTLTDEVKKNKIKLLQRTPVYSESLVGSILPHLLCTHFLSLSLLALSLYLPTYLAVYTHPYNRFSERFKLRTPRHLIPVYFLRKCVFPKNKYWVSSNISTYDTFCLNCDLSPVLSVNPVASSLSLVQGSG